AYVRDIPAVLEVCGSMARPGDYFLRDGHVILRWAIGGVSYEDQPARPDARSRGRPGGAGRTSQLRPTELTVSWISRYPGRPMPNASPPATIGELRRSGYPDRSVKD